jgi:hypothetical protein
MQFIAWIFKLFVLGMLCVLLFALLFGALWSLVRGRKPEVAVVWQKYQDMARNRAPFGTWSSRPQNDAEVVDVEVKEVPDKARQNDRLPRE